MNNISFIEQNIAIQQHAYGHPLSALKLKNIKIPDGDILVKVLYRAINPSDILSINGCGQYLYNHSVPRIPGFEAIGRVIRSKSVKFNVNDKVLVIKPGTWQKYMAVSEEHLLIIPEKLGNGAAAQLYINGLTAWIILTEVLNINKNDIVIINAGNSSIAKFFIQLSSSFGYKIIVSTSQVNKNKILESGCIGVVDSNYSIKEQLLKQNLPTPNIALDAVGGDVGARLLEAVCDNGIFIIYGCLSMHNYPNIINSLLKIKQIKPKRFFLRDWESRVSIEFRNAKILQLIDCILKINIQLPIYCEIDISQYQEAIKLYKNNQNNQNNHGKILISS